MRGLRFGELGGQEIAVRKKPQSSSTANGGGGGEREVGYKKRIEEMQSVLPVLAPARHGAEEKKVL